MKQKVWVIPDYDGDIPSAGSRTLDRPAQEQSPAASRANAPVRTGSRKSPALSFSLSMLVWGSGHMYIREYGQGSIFMAAMVFFYAALSALVCFRDRLSRFIVQMDYPAPLVVLGALAFFLAGLLFFLINAVHAYIRTANSRSEPFPGMENAFWPLLCSLLFPGWGQFLNAQPKKGVFFLLFGAMTVFSCCVFPVVHYAWPVLKAGPLTRVFDICLATSLLLLPVSLLLWIVAAYDAVRTCRERIRKRLRAKFPGYRVQSRWTVDALIPRWTAVLGLLLAISLGMQYFPRQYYLDFLGKVRIELLDGNLEILPDLLGKVRLFIDR